MREKVPHRRPGWAGGLVEIDDALLRGDERRERRDGLRYGCESDGSRNVPACRDGPAAVDHAGRGELDGPLVDLAKGLHAARY